MRSADFAPSRSVSALVSAVARLAARMREAGEHRRVVRSLATLDDHMLRDIGLTRFDIDSALVEPALADGTLLLAERARELRRHQRAMAQEARAWAALMPETDGRGAGSLVKRVA